MRNARGPNNAELAVLGLLAERDLHGYEMERVIGERGMRDWTEIGFSSIYRVLGALARRGLVEARLRPAPGRGSPRKVYRLSPAGRKAYVSGVTEALSRPQRLFPLVQQGLAGLPFVASAAAARALEHYAGELRERLAVVRRKNVPGLPEHVAWMFEYSERMIGAELAWAQDLARRMGRKA
jgi:DNA-binding PadR family transcriptional regulator